MDNKVCNSLTLFTSESCNLNCKYCDIAYHLNAKEHKNEAIKVKESLLNGQYLQTVKDACNKLGINQYNIEHLELWGQEPTLTLNEFNVFFPKLYEYCPNISTLMFSTNGVANINEIINLVKILNEIVTQKFHLTIQVSFDGYKQTQEHRGINPELIINNILNLINALNLIDLHLLEITIRPHNVIDKDTFTYFSNNITICETELYTYLKDFQDLYYLFLSKNSNQKVTITTFGAGIEVPQNATVEDGKNLTKFYLQCEKVGKNLTIKNWRQLIGQFSRNSNNWNANKILNLLNLTNQSFLAYQQNSIEELKKLSSNLGCSYNYSVLKIRYDGTLIHCQNALYALHTNDLTNIDNIIQNRKKDKHYYANIYTDSDDIIKNYIEQTRLRHEEAFLAAYVQAITLMSLLLYTQQIDLNYNNIHKFTKAAYYIIYSVPCPHNSMMYTGNSYGTYLGWIRLICNGFLDIVWQWQEGVNNVSKSR